MTHILGTAQVDVLSGGKYTFTDPQAKKEKKTQNINNTKET